MVVLIQTDNDTTPVAPIRKALRIKIEFSDNTGTKYSFNVEGTSNENITKLIDFAQSVSAETKSVPAQPLDTNFTKLFELIKTNFRFGSFTSGDIKDAYEHDFQIPISLSVVSTYLTRMARRNLLLRSRNGSGWTYKLNKLEQTLTEQSQ